MGRIVGSGVPARSLARAAALLALLAPLPGCAVLTPSQVDETRAFAEAAQGYGRLPGAVIVAHASVRRAVLEQRIADHKVDDAEKAELVWSELREELISEDVSRQQAAELDSLLGLLDQYARLLLRLTSDEYSEALGASAARLGTALDGAIRFHNEQSEDDVPELGDVAGGILRGAGGIYLRRQQTLLLKAYVEAGEDTVASLTTGVKALVAPFVTGQAAPGGPPVQSYFDQELDKMGGVYQRRALGKGRAEPSLNRAAAGVIEDAVAAQALGTRAIAAADSYQKAHQALAAALREKRDLADHLEEVRVLAEEVLAARRVAAEIES